MPTAINEHVSSYAIAPLAGEAFGRVALFGGWLITFYRQVIVGHLQLSMCRLGVQFKWLAWEQVYKKQREEEEDRLFQHDQYCIFRIGF